MGLDQNAGKLKHEYKYEFTNKEGEKSTHKWTNVGPFEWRKHARVLKMHETQHISCLHWHHCTIV